jgi:hypothetical protein
MSPRPSGRIDRSARIRALNDLVRQFPFGSAVGEVFITAGVAALPPHDQAALMIKVAEFDAFTPDNDPHGEHDFGAIDHAGGRYFWKIDYYDLQKQYHSPDPSDPAVTCRVLTIMQADEY